ncbi:hypothetical protein CROQUDRAFT_8078, partial [Cronartium quercuum f. sp. fusiforme G11]
LRPLTIRREDDNQVARLEKLRAIRKTATEAQIERAKTNKARFDSQFKPESSGKSHSTLVSYKVGDKVRLRNEAHTKREPHWFSPFEVFDYLGNNVYHLIDHRTSLFPHPISGNRLKPARIREGAKGVPWALPPHLAQETSPKVPRELKRKALKLLRTQEKTRPRIRIVGRFAT